MSETIHSTDVIQKLRHLKPELEQRYGVTQIGVFGSVARNEAYTGSDIDIVISFFPQAFAL